MKQICVALPEGAASVGCIEGSVKVFNIANEFLRRQGAAPLFNVSLVGADKNPRLYDGIFSMTADHAAGDNFPCDLLILPAVNGEMSEVMKINHWLLKFARKRYLQGTEVASLCVGAFLLAGTGLMDGKKCSTHWMAENEFRTMFPQVKMVSEKIITDEGGLYTSGGANSFWNLLLYILEKYSNRDLAISIAKYFEIDIGRENQSPFIMFLGQKQHQDEEVRQAQEFIEGNFREKISVDDLADKFAVGRRSLERRFRKATGYSIAEYVQKVKVEAAKKGFETLARNISEIMYDVGYNDTKAFRTVFKKHTGLSPLEYRNRYRRDLAA